MPKKWEEKTVVTIQKRKMHTDCKDYNEITLLTAVCKITSTLIQQQLAEHAKIIIGNQQSAFVKRRSTMDANHLVKQIK